jgi:hypothetical protein
MKLSFAYCCLVLILTASCQNHRDIIFKAIRNNKGNRIEILVFPGNEFNYLRNGKVTWKGQAEFTGKRLHLTSVPDSPLITAVHTEEYVVSGNKLCSTQDRNDCYSITVPVK